MALFKELPPIALNWLLSLINDILEAPLQTPVKTLDVHMILLPKGELQDLSKVRPICMGTSIKKLIAKVIAQNMGQALTEFSTLLPSNVGFIPEGECHHLILPLQMIFDLAQTQPKHKAPIFALQLDWTGAFDRLPWYLINQMLTHLGAPLSLLQWLEITRLSSKIYLKFPQGLDPNPTSYTPTRGTQQGCALSPILFTLTNDLLLRWLTDHTPGIPLGSQTLQTLAFADDVSVLTSSPHVLYQIITVLETWETLTGQTLNPTKTKILTNDISPSNRFYHRTNLIEQVTTFKYLGACVMAIPQDINATQIKTDFLTPKINKMLSRLAKVSSLPLDPYTKSAIIQSAIQSILPYGIYMMAPKHVPLKHLQTQILKAIKGPNAKSSLAHSILQETDLAKHYPFITQELPLGLFLDLHRLLNTPNLAAQCTTEYFRLISEAHLWPTNPLDPIVSTTPLSSKWTGTLIHYWREWQKYLNPTAQIHFISPLSSQNPGHWTGFFTSPTLNPDPPSLNRITYSIPEKLRTFLANHHVYNPKQLHNLSGLQWSQLSDTHRHLISDIQLQTPPLFTLPDPWQNPTFPPIPDSFSHSAADGGLKNKYTCHKV